MNWSVGGTPYSHTLIASDFADWNGVVNGNMTWWGAMGWVQWLNTTSYLGYRDWRLPTITDTGTFGCNPGFNGTDCGFNVNTATSELAHLYHVGLQNKAAYDTSDQVQQGYGLVDDPSNFNDESLFSNLQSWYYWSGAASLLDLPAMDPAAPDPYVSAGAAWVWDNRFGQQGVALQDVQLSTWAVRDGDVAAPSAVPEPASLALALAGLGLAGLARRRQAFGAS